MTGPPPIRQAALALAAAVLCALTAERRPVEPGRRGSPGDWAGRGGPVFGTAAYAQEPQEQAASTLAVLPFDGPTGEVEWVATAVADLLSSAFTRSLGF